LALELHQRGEVALGLPVQEVAIVAPEAVEGGLPEISLGRRRDLKNVGLNGPFWRFVQPRHRLEPLIRHFLPSLLHAQAIAPATLSLHEMLLVIETQMVPADHQLP
jgi:hypothetical protein